MPVFAIASQKGGAGKTTTTVHLAGAAQAAGFPVVILDADPQASATTWADGRETATISVRSIQPARIAAEIAKADPAALILIDTAPHAEAGILAAARVADYIVIPCRPAFFDVMAIRATLDIAKIAGKPAGVLLNACPPNAARALADAEEAIREIGADVLPARITQRAGLAHAITARQTAAEYGGTSDRGAAEYAALLDALRSRVNM